MKKISVMLLILLCFAVNLPFFTKAAQAVPTTEIAAESEPLEQNNSAVDNGSYSLDAVHPLIGSAKLSENVKSAIVYEANSQTLMYSWNPDAQMYPASFVKIMTALIALEKGSRESAVTVTQSALDDLPVDAMSSDLVVDEVMTLSDLVHCLLLGSANDAANVIAEHIGGSQASFVQMMNEYARDIGCTATQFTNASGLHDDNQHTTARDVAKILDAALKNDDFKEIFTKGEYDVPATNASTERRLINSSSIQDPGSKLYYDERVIGSRTGVTNDGRRCLAAAAENNGMLVITVVMGAESVYQEDGYSAISIGGYQETSLLLDSCLSGHKTAEILSDGQTLRQIPVQGGKNHLVMGPKVSFSTVLPENITAAGLTFQYTDKALSLPIEKGQHVCDVTIWNGNMCVGQAELFAMNRVEAAEVVEQTGNTDNSNSAPVGRAYLIVILVAVGIFLAFFIFVRIRKHLKSIRRRRHRRSRKRIR